MTDLTNLLVVAALVLAIIWLILDILRHVR
jgi:hypothetical protein